jgi:release factor glutamine methyltransferase
MRTIPQLRMGASVSEAMGAMSRWLRLAGIDTPEVDTRILLGHALHLTRAQLLSQSNRILEAREIETISALAVRRMKREPVSRIIGYREFWNLTLQITSDVLDPRSDTETLIEVVLDFVTHNHWSHDKLRILDIGTGSGAILLALLRELPYAVGTATDISEAAIAVARINAQRYGLSHRSNFIVSNIATSLAGHFDVIVSNPPYIRSNEIRMLEPEVRNYDPVIALDGNADGLGAYRSLAQQAGPLLAAKGRLFVELGIGQESSVSAIFTCAGLKVSPARTDLAGIPRALTASLALSASP